MANRGSAAIHGRRNREERAKDILYMHDTIETFATRSDALRTERATNIRHALPAKSIRTVQVAAAVAVSGRYRSDSGRISHSPRQGLDCRGDSGDLQLGIDSDFPSTAAGKLVRIHSFQCASHSSLVQNRERFRNRRNLPRFARIGQQLKVIARRARLPFRRQVQDVS